MQNANKHFKNTGIKNKYSLEKYKFLSYYYISCSIIL